MLKKAIITAAAVVAATVGVTGVAYAGDYDSDGSHSDNGSDHGSHHRHGHGHGHGDKNSPNCSSHEETTQINKGFQLLGNIVAKHINGAIAGSIEKPAVCPSIGNNNKIFGH